MSTRCSDHTVQPDQSEPGDIAKCSWKEVIQSASVSNLTVANFGWMNLQLNDIVSERRREASENVNSQENCWARPTTDVVRETVSC
jgi:hypothetical protein